jgi:hypothetical protein
VNGVARNTELQDKSNHLIALIQVLWFAGRNQAERRRHAAEWIRTMLWKASFEKTNLHPQEGHITHKGGGGDWGKGVLS